ncbi:MAG: ribose 5-phosphate isomerase B [Candidatus Woesearchaeota archaeon]
MIYIASDHAGYRLKEFLKKYFEKNNIKYSDFGTYNERAVDYPDYAFKVAKKVAKQKGAKGILICGTGTGMVIAANRIKGVRASLCYDNYSAVMSRKHNNSNILCLRARKVNFEKQLKITLRWMKTKFSNEERHKRRIKKLDKIN